MANQITTPRYKAYIKFEYQGETRELRVFPRSKKTSCFRSVADALKMLEAKTRTWKFNSFGRVTDKDGNFVTNIAL